MTGSCLHGPYCVLETHPSQCYSQSLSAFASQLLYFTLHLITFLFHANAYSLIKATPGQIASPSIDTDKTERNRERAKKRNTNPHASPGGTNGIALLL